MGGTEIASIPILAISVPGDEMQLFTKYFGYIRFIHLLRAMKINQKSLEAPNLPLQIRDARIAKGFKMAECSRELKITTTYWSRLERGMEPSISIDRLSQIEKLLNVCLMPKSTC
jgi:hypothetical protein